jgi:hypothetical protein
MIISSVQPITSDESELLQTEINNLPEQMEMLMINNRKNRDDLQT